MKVNVIFWSGTGNTEAMANEIVNEINLTGHEGNLIFVGDATLADVDECDVVLFGCSAMGEDELEEEFMRPFMDKANTHLNGKKVGLFGSYEWYEGGWMDIWEDEIKAAGADLIAPGVKAYDFPDDKAMKSCRDLASTAVSN